MPQNREAVSDAAAAVSISGDYRMSWLACDVLMVRAAGYSVAAAISVSVVALLLPVVMAMPVSMPVSTAIARRRERAAA